MSRLFDLIGGEDISVEERWKILDILFDPKPIAIATACIFLASLVGWQSGLHVWAAGWSFSAFFLLVGRLLLIRAYRSRSDRSAVDIWKKRFAISCFATGLQWGIGALAFVETDDIAVIFTLFAVLTGMLGGASARGSCFPTATSLQVSTAAVLIAVCGAYSGLWIFAGLMMLYLANQIGFINSLARVNLKQILSDKERKVLLESLERTNAEIASANARLQEISMTDALTGIANRRSFDKELAVFWAQAARQKTSLGLLFIDVDHFKNFNDSHGHLTGDACLSIVASAIRDAVRDEADRVSRYGGEEFAVLLPHTTATGAVMVAERVARAVRSSPIPVGDGRSIFVSVSVGVAAIVPDQELVAAMLVSLADQAVYRAKQDGRDCVRVGGAPDDHTPHFCYAVPLVPAAVSPHQRLPLAAAPGAALRRVAQ